MKHIIKLIIDNELITCQVDFQEDLLEEVKSELKKNGKIEHRWHSPYTKFDE